MYPSFLLHVNFFLHAEDLSYDWVEDKLYFVDDLLGVGFVDPVTSVYTILIEHPPARPTGIAVDPYERYITFFELGQVATPPIFKITLPYTLIDAINMSMTLQLITGCCTIMTSMLTA